MAGTHPDGTDEKATLPDPKYDLGFTGERVLTCLSLGLVVFDRNLNIIHHNPAAEYLVSGCRSIAEALARGTVDARYQDWRQALMGVIERGREQRFDQVVRQDNQQGERLLNLLCIPWARESGGEVSGGILVIEDVTAVVGMEKRLAVSERMAAVGNLAARVAHELNNPLDGILRYINLALRAGEIGRPEKITEYLTQARGGLLRMTEIVRELVEFSRSTAAAFDDAGINTIVDEAVKVMSDKAVAAGVSIVCTLSEDVPAVRGTNLFQVFCNLIKNAIDAMPNGGTLTIATQVVDGEAIIRFEDNGIGLPEEMDRIFEPFFTTKPPGKGTGLGLPICKDIVEKYNGKIIPQRRPQGGTAFTIRLPLQSCTAMRPSAGSGAVRSRFSRAPREAKT
ncbi:MAG TPA: ATP-binding protein [Phycisphaerae bacterium]|nr:ATP-binding protein [Phycisphaerae bacterium]HRR86726.1 ATP-binding protein [Phycisphaerae bacterium]